MLGHKTSLSTFKSLKSYKIVFDQGGVKLEISNDKITKKTPNTWK